MKIQLVLAAFEELSWIFEAGLHSTTTAGSHGAFAAESCFVFEALLS